MPLNGVAYPSWSLAPAPSSYAGQVGPVGLSSRSLALRGAYDAQAANVLWYRLNRSLLQLRDEAANLARPDLWNAKSATSSDSKTVAATAQADAAPGTYAVGVTALAKAEKLGSATFTTTATPLGASGTFKVNGRDITVEATDTLVTLADKINGRGAKVLAKVEAAAEGGYRLTLTSETTGQAGVMTLSDTTPGTLTQLGLVDATGQKAVVLEAAADAVFTVNGKEYTSGTNNPVVSGVALTLQRTTTAPVTVSVTVTHDDQALVEAARKFVEAHNTALADVGRMTLTGSLAGRTQAMKVQRDLVAALQGPAVRADEAPPRPGEIGFQFGPGGTLTLDEAAFRKRLEASRESASKAFTSPSGAAEQVKQVLAPLTSPVSGYTPSLGEVPAASWVASQTFSSVTGGLTPREADLYRQASVLQSSLDLLARQRTGVLDRVQALFAPLT